MRIHRSSISVLLVAALTSMQPFGIVSAQTPLDAAAASGVPTTPIQHVVVIFQENVSFDHYFATYPVAANSTTGEPSFTAKANTPTVNGLTAGLLTNNPNSAQPFRLTRAQAVTCDQDHNYGDEQKAFNGGLMNKFVETVSVAAGSCDQGLGTKIVMGYFDGNTVTALWNYAQNFAMNDNSFNSQFGPSTPGALNLISGQTHGATVTTGPPAGNVSNGSVIGDPRPSGDDCNPANKTLITMSGKNVGDLMNAKGITWGWFQGGFAPTSRNADGTAVCAAAHANIPAAAPFGDYIPHHQPFQYYASTANPHHLAPTSVAMIGQTDQANHQYDISDFWNAANAGNLPAVSFLKAPAYQDGHAGYSDPLNEQTFLVNTISALEKLPAWNSTAVIIAYDDSDGWYDHVLGPILVPSNTTDDQLTGVGACGTAATGAYQGRCGYGPRLPLLVISPWAKANFVDHTTTDQASILRFIEDNWSLGRIGDQSLDAMAGPLNNMFNFQGTTPTNTGSVFLDPATGAVVSITSTNAVANPKGQTTIYKQVQLDGTKSTAANGGPLTYSWQLLQGGGTAALANSNSATPNVQFASAGSYMFQLTVTDSTGVTSTDTATLVYVGR